MTRFRFTRHKNFLRIEDTKSGTDVFLKKQTVFVKKTNDSAFMIMDGSYTGYFELADVEEPSTSSLDEVLDKVLDIINSLEIHSASEQQLQRLVFTTT